MRKEFSLYLDLVRFLAAVTVVIYHSNYRELIPASLPIRNAGHSAVIVFFVLSGFVVAYVVDTKERTALEYWSSRLSRIYSVAVPAVILTLILDNIGEQLVPHYKTTHDYGYVRIFSSLVFMNEFWTVSIQTFSNVPYWSLCYEMWYYITFGIIMFIKGAARIWLIVGCCLLLGPKILLLSPIWYVGVYLYRSKRLNSITPFWGGVIFLVSIVACVKFHQFYVTDYFLEKLKMAVGPYWYIQLAFSKYFLSDYLLVLIVAFNFVGFRAISHLAGPLLFPIAKPIRFLASFTFSLYIYHQPVMLFFAALIDGDATGYLFYSQVIFCTALTILLLGFMTEQQRGKLKHWLAARFERAHLRWQGNLRVLQGR